MRVFSAVLALTLVGVAAGCGGSSGGSWSVLVQQTFKPHEAAYLHTSVGRPSQLEVQVHASPNVQSTTNYSADCGNESPQWHRRGPAGKTPLTGRVVLPPGPPGSCFFAISATPAQAAKITVVLLTRASAGPT
ncbi:MAG: hypothetical protein JO186_08400 [Actinobacteria bacterium]|nr:hypothetical protein [Actinomycetota bacterium]MBV8394812.1 hypothetical protein [Actinomycetota bacterium]